MSVFIALLALFIKPTDVDPRFGLGVGALFAAVAGTIVLASQLPDNAGMTAGNFLNSTCVTIILLSLVESVISLRLAEANRWKLSSRVDMYSFAALTAMFVATVAALIMA